jgi:hypothetical protein
MRWRPKALALLAVAVAAVAAGAYVVNSFEPAGHKQKSVDEAAPAAAVSPKPIPTPPTRLATIEEPTRSLKKPESPSNEPDTREINQWFMEAYLKCWSPPANIPPDRDYGAKIRIVHNANGSVAGAPLLVNPPSDPDWRPFAESAVQAVKKCNGLSIPQDYLPRFERWRKMTLYFSPDGMHP